MSKSEAPRKESEFDRLHRVDQCHPFIHLQHHGLLFLLLALSQQTPSSQAE
jgi:hypothetical protein